MKNSYRFLSPPSLFLAQVLFLTISLSIGTISQASQLELRSESILRMMERDTSTEKDKLLLPFYEYLEINLRELSDSADLSVHLYGWGRADFVDSNYFSDNTDGSLLYGYLQMQSESGALKIKLGRQNIFSGITNEPVDGLSLGAKIPLGFKFSAYGGSPVAVAEEGGRSGDSIYGGRLAHSYGTLYELGLSYKELTNNSNNKEKKAGLDLSLFLPGGVGFYGMAARNMETREMSEYSLESRFSLGPVDFRPSFQRFIYDDYFMNEAKRIQLFKNIAARVNDETLTTAGGDVVLNLSDKSSLSFRTKHFTYDKRGNSSQFYSTLLNWQPSERSLNGLELGYMDGDNTVDQYFLARIHTYLDQLMGGSVFISGEAMYVGYEEPIYGIDRSIFASLGGGSKFLNKTMEVKVSADYTEDPYFDKDFRGQLTLKYIFN